MQRHIHINTVQQDDLRDIFAGRFIRVVTAAILKIGVVISGEEEVFGSLRQRGTFRSVFSGIVFTIPCQRRGRIAPARHASGGTV